MKTISKTFKGQAHSRLLSGAIHYFRVVPEYWEDRLQKLKYLGLNTVETYTAWNMHEPKPGKFVFKGGLDVEKFISLAGELELQVIVRPGPFICAEWEFGGLPAWLLADPGIQLRCVNPAYLAAIDRYFDELIPRLAKFQVIRDGPLIAVQVENEYGSYGSDAKYLRYLSDGMRARGLSVPFFTSDGATDWMLVGGTLPGVLKTVNFGNEDPIVPDAVSSLAKLREHQPDGPLMCAEFWNQNTVLHWGGHFKRRSPQEVAKLVDKVLSAGAALNQYMFHGGTNFGFMNGANYDGGRYKPHITSYDHDGLLDEAGDPTPKYYAVREVMGKYVSLPQEQPPPSLPKAAYGKVELTEFAPLFDVLENLGAPEQRVTPEPMEKLGQDYGFILYRTTVTGPREPMPLVLQEVHDRAQIFVDGEYKGVIERWGPQDQVMLGFSKGEHRLDVLVENMGRINYGPYLRDYKGVTDGIRLERQFLCHWQIFSLPLNNISSLPFESGIKLNQLQKSVRNPPRPSSVAQGAMMEKSATPPPAEGIFLPKADPPLAEMSSKTRCYAPLMGGVREAGGGSEDGRRRLLQVAQLKVPIFCRGCFEVDKVADTFLALPGWTKGVCFINGFNLGRYWEIGPQMTFFLPAPLLHAGKNEIIVFELHGMKEMAVEFRDRPEWR
ncbi:MAG: beta-galactosidase [Kiritimatiellae bacterium]|nr:beta-galactosidase [Kiritimatiellia bacterium]